MSDETPAPNASLATRITTVRDWITQQTPEIATALPQGMDAARFGRMALTAVLRNPKLATCSRATFVLALMEAAGLGLDIDSQSGLAYLVPYENKRTGEVVCQLIVGYRGMIQLAYRHPKVVGFNAEVVHANDRFKLALGARPKLEHEPVFQQDRGPITGAYAVADIKGGRPKFVYMPVEEIEEHRKRSRAKDNGPWITDYAAMCKKTPVRSLCKLIPQSPQLVQALTVEDDPAEERPEPTLPVPSGTPVSDVLDAIADAEEPA